MVKENSTPDPSKRKPPDEADEVIRDLIRPEDLEEDEPDGPRDPTTQDRGGLFFEPTPPETEAETVRKPNAFGNNAASVESKAESASQSES